MIKMNSFEIGDEREGQYKIVNPHAISNYIQDQIPSKTMQPNF